MTTTLERPVTREQRPVRAAGLLDTTDNGHGTLRVHGGRPSPDDIQVSSALIRRHGLRKGDAVEGGCDWPRTLSSVDRVNGLAPEDLRGRRRFHDLTPVHPRDGCGWRRRTAGPHRASSISSRPSARASAA